LPEEQTAIGIAKGPIKIDRIKLKNPSPFVAPIVAGRIIETSQIIIRSSIINT
jgi:hypothetical protein